MASSPSTMRRRTAVHAAVAGELGVERRGQQASLADGDDPTGGRSTGDRARAPRRPAPDLSTQGARMKTACSGPSARPATSTSASNESTWRPNALRRTVMSIPPRSRWSGGASRIRSASMIMPAQEPVHRQAAPDRARAAARAGRRRGQLGHRRGLAAGEDQAVDPPSSSGRRTGTGSAPQARSASTCSRTSPCRASTPTTGRSPRSFVTGVT